MRSLEIPIPLRSISTSESIEDQISAYSYRLYDWLQECHGFVHNVALIVASASFVLYLAFQAKYSCRKLTIGKSHIINSYYAIVWTVSVLNIAWCSLQTWVCTPGKEAAWNVLTLITTSGMLFLEVSLIAFLLQGNSSRGSDALARTFAVSGLIVGLDIFLKAMYVFGFGIPIFIESEDHAHLVKWGLWVLHKLILTAVYGMILFMYHSKWRGRLPGRPAFHKYVVIMFVINAAALFACGLSGNGVGFGFWLYDTTIVCYHALYLPLLYITFLADFFQEEDLNLENMYYSEMKDAGFLDPDWD